LYCRIFVSTIDRYIEIEMHRPAHGADSMRAIGLRRALYTKTSILANAPMSQGCANADDSSARRVLTCRRGKLRPMSFPRLEPSEAGMDEDRFNMAVRQFLKVVGVTSQREIERVVRDHGVEGGELKLKMTLTAENAPLEHVVKETIKLG
jgi:hypothetical protein